MLTLLAEMNSEVIMKQEGQLNQAVDTHNIAKYSHVKLFSSPLWLLPQNLMWLTIKGLQLELVVAKAIGAPCKIYRSSFTPPCMAFNFNPHATCRLELK